jgi:acylphosphatase
MSKGDSETTPSKPDSTQHVRVHIVVAGRVQGVGFRYATVEAATRFGVRGWVRNTRNGRVEIIAAGSRDKVKELVDWCHHGPALATVSAVECSEVTTDEELGDFEVRPTR